MYLEKNEILRKPFLSYVLSNHGNFIFRFVNGAFGSKWAGFWSFDKKYLDYWAIKINGEWLSPENIIEFKYDKFFAEHTYKIKDGVVSERISIRNDGLTIELLSDIEKNLNLEIEFGIDIRYRDERIKDDNYKISKDFIEYTIYNSLGSVKIIGDLNFIEKRILKRHFPGIYLQSMGYDYRYFESEQTVFIPGIFWKNISGTGRKWIKIDITTDRVRKKVKFESLPYIFSNDPEIQNIYKFVQKKISYYFSEDFIAGFPYFNQFWVRDFLFCSKTLLNEGYIDELEFYFDKILKMGIPTVFDKEISMYHSDDVFPEFLYFFTEFVYRTGRKRLLERYYNFLVNKIDEFLKKDYNKDYLIENRGYGTWMDSLYRPKALEIQIFLSSSLKRFGKLIDSSDYIRKGEIIEKRILETYKSLPEYQKPDINLAFFAFLDEIPKDILERIEKLRVGNQFLTSIGKSNYHTGTIWPFTNFIVSYLFYRFGREDSIDIIKSTFKNIGKQCLEGINEYFNPNPAGACMQAWSEIPAVWILDEILLGVGFDNKFNERNNVILKKGLSVSRKIYYVGGYKVISSKREDETSIRKVEEVRGL